MSTQAHVRRKRMKKRIAVMEYQIASMQPRIDALQSLVAYLRTALDRPKVPAP